MKYSWSIKQSDRLVVYLCRKDVNECIREHFSWRILLISNLPNNCLAIPSSQETCLKHLPEISPLSS